MSVEGPGLRRSLGLWETTILLAILITAGLYLLVALSAVAVVGADALGVSVRPLADVASEVLGGNAARSLR